MILLPPEFSRLLSALASNEVEYLVVGGYAVIHHGYVRTTGDLDIWVGLNTDNAAKLEQSLRSLGFNPPGMKADWFTRKGSVLRIGTEPLRFDIINHIDGVVFPECYERRVEADVGGVKVNFISLQDLKANKKASARNKDLADLDYLP
jgi:predicted nucleotidyltransferase